MRRAGVWLLAGAVLWTTAAAAQGRRIVIPAGTPEDHVLQELGKISDPAARRAKLHEFVEEFAANPAAVTFGHWQLAQLYEAEGDLERALAHGDKALEAAPDNLDILVSQAALAQQRKESGRVFEYARRGGEAFHAMAAEAAAATDARTRDELEEARPSYEFMEAAAFNALTEEQDPKTRMALIEGYISAFPGSRFEEQVAQYAIYTLQQLNDPQRLVTYAERALAVNPESLPTLALLASAFSEEQGTANLSRAVEYARKAVSLAGADAPDADDTSKSWAGVAYAALGYALLRQERTAPAIAELQRAAPLLKSDPSAYSTVLFRLGYANAKLNRLTAARAVLMEAVQIEGPFQQAARELLAKVNAARAGRD